jgi:hypothetical protein
VQMEYLSPLECCNLQSGEAQVSQDQRDLRHFVVSILITEAKEPNIP